MRLSRAASAAASSSTNRRYSGLRFRLSWITLVNIVLLLLCVILVHLVHRIDSLAGLCVRQFALNLGEMELQRSTVSIECRTLFGAEVLISGCSANSLTR